MDDDSAQLDDVLRYTEEDGDDAYATTFEGAADSFPFVQSAYGGDPGRPSAGGLYPRGYFHEESARITPAAFLRAPGSGGIGAGGGGSGGGGGVGKGADAGGFASTLPSFGTTPSALETFGTGKEPKNFATGPRGNDLALGGGIVGAADKGRPSSSGADAGSRATDPDSLSSKAKSQRKLIVGLLIALAVILVAGFGILLYMYVLKPKPPVTTGTTAAKESFGPREHPFSRHKPAGDLVQTYAREHPDSQPLLCTNEYKENPYFNEAVVPGLGENNYYGNDHNAYYYEAGSDHVRDFRPPVQYETLPSNNALANGFDNGVAYHARPALSSISAPSFSDAAENDFYDQMNGVRVPIDHRELADDSLHLPPPGESEIVQSEYDRFGQERDGFGVRFPNDPEKYKLNEARTEHAQTKFEWGANFDAGGGSGSGGRSSGSVSRARSGSGESWADEGGKEQNEPGATGWYNSHGGAQPRAQTPIVDSAASEYATGGMEGERGFSDEYEAGTGEQTPQFPAGVPWTMTLKSAGGGVRPGMTRTEAAEELDPKALAGERRAVTRIYSSKANSVLGRDGGDGGAEPLARVRPEIERAMGWSADKDGGDGVGGSGGTKRQAKRVRGERSVCDPLYGFEPVPGSVVEESARGASDKGASTSPPKSMHDMYKEHLPKFQYRDGAHSSKSADKLGSEGSQIGALASDERQAADADARERTRRAEAESSSAVSQIYAQKDRALRGMTSAIVSSANINAEPHVEYSKKYKNAE